MAAALLDDHVPRTTRRKLMTSVSRSAVSGNTTAVPAIAVDGLHKRYGTVEVLKGIDFRAHDGEVVSILDASGSGKSTLLRCLLLRLAGCKSSAKRSICDQAEATYVSLIGGRWIACARRWLWFFRISACGAI
jgi:ABC-type glutathione transport system ATPase component